ncbi:MAG: hypothetical protein DWH78_06950 [Planctomycetota bacterium]|nr:MAG: hypothetical protein DWH78_06950 [Planctomycetota bacterium]
MGCPGTMLNSLRALTSAALRSLTDNTLCVNAAVACSRTAPFITTVNVGVKRAAASKRATLPLS